MSWRFRQSFRLFPGVRINLSKSGISTTIGAGPLSVNVGRRGVRGTASIPGAGVSFQHQLIGGGARSSGRQQADAGPQDTIPDRTPLVPSEHSNPVVRIQPSDDPDKYQIRSASTYELSSEGLAGFRKLLADAHEEQHTLDVEIGSAQREFDAANSRYEQWAQGFLVKRIRKGSFAKRQEAAEEARDRLAELREQRGLTVVATEIDVSKEIIPSFGRVCDAFSQLAESRKVWDTLSSQEINRAALRTVAANAIERTEVKFDLGSDDLLKCEWKVPHLENANGGDISLYPGFLLYRVSRKSFAVLDCKEVSVSFALTGFLEEEGVPDDADVVGQTWKYANKNGQRDMRFSDNYQIPVVGYGKLKLSSPTGLNEEYMISNAKAASDFAEAWQAFRKAISHNSGDSDE